MNRRTGLHRGAGLLALLLVAEVCSAQGVDPVLELSRLLVLSRPSAVAVHPDGSILVADPSGGRVVRVDSTGRVLGSAAEGAAGASFRPGGIDATNGLLLFVVEPETGRILRFARDGRFLEAMPVAGGDDDVSTSFARREGSSSGASDGRPISVAATDDGRMFVVDEAVAGLRIYDLGRRLLRTVGRAFGDKLPIRPVAVARGYDRIWVADAGLPGLVVFDRFGGLLRTLGVGSRRSPVSVAVGPSGIWLVEASSVRLFSPNGEQVGRFGWDASIRAVGVAEAPGRLYVLTNDGLYVAIIP